MGKRIEIYLSGRDSVEAQVGEWNIVVHSGNPPTGSADPLVLVVEEAPVEPAAKEPAGEPPASGDDSDIYTPRHVPPAYEAAKDVDEDTDAAADPASDVVKERASEEGTGFGERSDLRDRGWEA